MKNTFSAAVLQDRSENISLAITKIKEVLKKLSIVFFSVLDNVFPQRSGGMNGMRSGGFRDFKRFAKRSLLLPFGIVFIIVLAITVMTLKSMNQTVATKTTSDGRVVIKDAKATQEINKKFLFPLKDQNGKEVSKLEFVVTDVELRDEIILKGVKNVAINGRTYLIINLKVTNSYNKPVGLLIRDYFRLKMNGTNEKLAADIHNDPVEVQADATKFTRLSYPIKDEDKDLILMVGELEGKKEEIRLTL